MRKLFAFGAALFAVCSAPAFADPSPELVQNGGFENGLTSWNSFGWGTNPTYGSISGTTSASTGCVGPSCTDPTYPYSARLSQTLTTTPGSLYDLSFDYNWAGNPSELLVQFGGVTVADFLNGGTNITTHYSLTNLQTLSPLTDLTFFGRQDPAYSALDNVSVHLSGTTGAVPEPATWAMMLLGFGAIGMATRRKRTPVLARA